MGGTIKLSLFLAAVPVVSVDSLNEPFKWTRQKFAHPLIFVSNSDTKGDAARNAIQNEHFLKYHSYKRRAEFLHHVLFRRGGESADQNDIAADEEEIPMSHFMSSFESELAEIRREAELEAEKEMQKLRGMLEGSEDIYYDEEVDEEKVMREAYMDRENEDDLDDEEVDGEGEHQLDELCSNDSVVYRDDSREENERGMEEQEGGNDEETYDLDASSESTESLRKDNQTMEIEETAREEDRGEMIELSDVEGTLSMISEEQVEEISAAGEEMIGKVDYDSETKRTAIIENEIIEIEEKNSSEHPIPSTLDVMTTTEAKPKSSKKRKVGKMTNTAGSIITTSKKPKTKKGKAKAKKARLDEVVDIGSITDIHDFSSGGTIRKMGTQQSVEETLTQRNGELESSRSRSMTSLIRSDLVRALTLFIATVAVSVWMQRVQRQLEAQGN